jgi:hypothetical protein
MPALLTNVDPAPRLRTSPIVADTDVALSTSMRMTVIKDCHDARGRPARRAFRLAHRRDHVVARAPCSRSRTRYRCSNQDDGNGHMALLWGGFYRGPERGGRDSQLRIVGCGLRAVGGGTCRRPPSRPWRVRPCMRTRRVATVGNTIPTFPAAAYAQARPARVFVLDQWAPGDRVDLRHRGAHGAVWVRRRSSCARLTASPWSSPIAARGKTPATRDSGEDEVLRHDSMLNACDAGASSSGPTRDHHDAERRRRSARGDLPDM